MPINTELNTLNMPNENGVVILDSDVILEDEDFEAADAVKTKMIEIINFVDQREIDSFYYEQ